MLEFNCIILAGGASTRLQTDKALIHFKGKSLLQQLVDELKPLVKEIIIVSNNPNHQLKGCKSIKEDHEKIGPIGGLKVGMENSNSNWNLALSVDMPLLNLRMLVDLLTSQVDDNFKAIVPEADEQTQYLAGLYHKYLAKDIALQIEQKEFSLKQLFEKANATKITKSTLDFSNINAVQDIENLGYTLLQVITFGQVHERLKLTSFAMISTAKNLEDLHAEITTYYPTLKDVTFKIAVNQSFEKEDYVLKSGDAIALLPPFAGG